MLFVLFQIGEDTYAVEATHVVEVLPWVHIKAVPESPPGLAGLINHRGAAIAAVDLYATALQRPARRLRSTRLLIVPSPQAPGGRLALLAERATECARLDPAQFQPATTRGAACLGPVATLPDGRLIQWVKPDALLSAAAIVVLAAQPAIGS